MTINEVGWDQSRVAVHHNGKLKADQIKALLLATFFEHDDAADFSKINIHTHKSRYRAGLQKLGAHSIGAAITHMFNPGVGILEVTAPLIPEPPLLTPKDVEFYNILREDFPTDPACKQTVHWRDPKVFKSELREQRLALGEHTTRGALTFGSFIMQIALPRASVVDAPSLISTPGGEFSITHPRRPNPNGLYLRTNAPLPHDAAITFRGQKWQDSIVTGINAYGGRAGIDRNHALASRLTSG